MSAPGTAMEPGPAGGGSAFSRVYRVFYEPTAVFQELAATPTWLPPLIVLLVFAIGAQLVIAPKIDMDATIRASMGERAEQMSDEQLDQAVEMGKKFGRVSMFITPVTVPVVYLLVSLFYFLGLKVVGSETEFRSVFATVLHAILPAGLASSVLMLIVTWPKSGIVATELEGMVKSNLGAIMGPDASKPLVALAGVLDVFNLWQWVLLVIGLGIVGRVTRGKAIGMVAVAWIAWAAIKVGLAALR